MRRSSLAIAGGTSTLHRETFRTSRLLEYFSEKELVLQTGHEPERWAEVVVKELVDNALDACEEANMLPEIHVELRPDRIVVIDNGPGIPEKVIQDVLDYSVRTSSKDAYVSPTRGQQGNALKTVVAIPYVLNGCESGQVSVMTRGQHHQIRIAVDRIAQQPDIQHTVSVAAFVKSGTRIEVHWPADSACSILDDGGDRFLQMLESYSLLNPHAAFTIQIGRTRPRVFPRTVNVCEKWIASQPTSPHWYTAEQLRNLVAAYVHAERTGGRPRTVREFVSEFRGLSGTAKQKAILAAGQVRGVQLRDLVRDGDIDRPAIDRLLAAMQAESRPIKPLQLGILGEAYLTAWLKKRSGKEAAAVTYRRTADVDEESGRPFVVETAFAVRTDDGEMQLITGINSSPTLLDPFRALDTYGLSLQGLLRQLHLSQFHPVTFVLHLTCPHLNFSDRGKSSLEAL